MASASKEDLFEKESIPRSVALLSVPTVISSLVSLLYSLADTYFVGLLNDPVQTAAVTLAATVLLAFYAIINLFGVGASSMMSRALGAGDQVTLRRSSALGFWGAVFVSALFALACKVFMQPLLNLLGADSATAGATEKYLFWTVCLGTIPAVMNVVISYMIRSEGAALHASIGTMSGCLLNILLDPVFILPGMLNLGAEGAALATLISNSIACLYFAFYLIRKRKTTCVCVDPRELKWDPKVIGGVCEVGIPAAIQNLLNVTSHTLLNNMASPFGAEALAAMGISAKLSMVPWYISNGISQGVMPLIGYNYAAKNYHRMKNTLWFTVRISLGLLLLMCSAMCIFSGQLTALFIDHEQTIAYGTVFLRAMSLQTPLLALDFMAVGVFQAIGRGRKSLLMAFFRKIVFEIPALFILNAIFPLHGLAWAQTLSEALMAIVGSLMLLKLIRELEKPQAPLP